MSELRLSSIEQGLSVDQVIALTEVEKRYELKQAELDLYRTRFPGHKFVSC